jgi:hypothetical protein
MHASTEIAGLHERVCWSARVWAPQGECWCISASRSITSIQLHDLCEQDKQVQIREAVCSRLNRLRVLLSPLLLSHCPQSESTPLQLHHAAMMGRVEEAKKLIAEGADIEAVDKVRCARFYNIPAGVTCWVASVVSTTERGRMRCVPTHSSSQSCVVCECMHG